LAQLRRRRAEPFVAAFARGDGQNASAIRHPSHADEGGRDQRRGGENEERRRHHRRDRADRSRRLAASAHAVSLSEFPRAYHGGRAGAIVRRRRIPAAIEENRLFTVCC
jgi:hypothetical protein